MERIRTFVVRYQMLIFVLLTYLLSWAFIIPAQGGLIPQGPMIAAFIVLAIVSGRQGVADLWRRMTGRGVQWKWFLIAPAIFFAIHLITLAINLMLGARIVSTDHLRPLSAFLGLLLPLVLVGGWWEEPGWTGYALPRFQERFAGFPLAAILATGLIRMVWHTPLLLSGAIPWFDYIFYSFAMQFILAWLYRGSHGSVLIAMIGHLFSNILWATFSGLFQGPDLTQYWVIVVTVSWAVTLGLMLLRRSVPGEKPVESPA